MNIPGVLLLILLLIFSIFGIFAVSFVFGRCIRIR